jgi:hypothetical protein
MKAHKKIPIAQWIRHAVFPPFPAPHFPATASWRQSPMLLAQTGPILTVQHLPAADTGAGSVLIDIYCSLRAVALMNSPHNFISGNWPPRLTRLTIGIGKACFKRFPMSPGFSGNQKILYEKETLSLIT